MNEHAPELVWLLWTILGGLILLIIGVVKMYLVDLRRWQSNQEKVHGELMKLVSSLSTRVAHIEGRLGINHAAAVEEEA